RSGLIYCYGGLSGKYYVLEVCQIVHYARGKENGVNIFKLIDEGPFQIGTFRETLIDGEEGAFHLGPERPRVYSDLSMEENERYNADIRATNILLQGLPKDIYTHINHYTDAKDIRDNVKMLLEGFELTKEDQESQMYDDVEHFCQNIGETIHDYYVRFSKLINDMRNIKMTMSIMQLNSKFVNNMLPEWGRFVTAMKLNTCLRDSNYDQLYAYLKQYEAHANENKMMLDRFSQHTGQRNNAKGTGATGYGGAQNRVGNVNPGQARQIKCYNCNADKCDVFDYDVDEAPTTQTMFMANLSSADPVYDEVGPSYDSDILYELNCMKDGKFKLAEREQKIEEQLRIVITDRNIKEENLKKELRFVTMQLNSNINHNNLMVEKVTSLNKDFKQKENKYLEEFLDKKALKKVEDRLFKQDQSLQVHMLCKPKPHYDEQRKVAIGYKNLFYLSKAKQVQPALYSGQEIVKPNHACVLVHDSEDTLEIAKTTKNQMNEKMKDP
nr:integrase, catalytic region, zinc finger, CCHC-type, peptidase aspartic, catalytic [Tanacetum cinerariifolium]